MFSSTTRSVISVMDRFIGEQSNELAVRRRQQVLAFVLLTVIVGGLPLGLVLVALLGSHPTVYLTFGTLFANLTALIVLRRLSNPTIAASLFLTAFAGGLLLISVAGGGIGSGAVLWLVIIPFIAGLLLPVRMAAAFTVLVAVGLVSLFVFDTVIGNPWAADPVNEIVAGIDLACGLSALVAAHLIAFYNERVVVRMRRVVRRRDQELQEARRAEALGRMAAGIAHDFNNLMTVVAYEADMLRLEGLGSEAKQSLAGLDAVVEQSTALTSGLLNYISSNMTASADLDVAATVRRLVPEFREILGNKIEFVLDELAHDLPVRISPVQFERALLALAQNARDAMPSGGAFSIVVRGLTRKETDGVEIVMTDTGEGMTADVLDRAFEPFFTTRAMTRGTGLSLASVRGLVRQYGGTIDVESTPGEGSTFRIWLPLSGADRPIGKRPEEISPTTLMMLALADDRR